MEDRIDALQNIEEKLQLLYTQQGQISEVSGKQYYEEREPLLTRRCELVTGQEEPCDEELVGFDLGVDVKSSSKGVPFFWLNVLCNQDTLAEHITARDRLVLEHLEDVRYVQGHMGMLVEFIFAENPYFSDRVLRRGATFYKDEEGNIVDVAEEFTTIDWYPDMDVTVEEVTLKGHKRNKKGKKGKRGNKAAAEEEAVEAAVRVIQRPCASFFRFFLPLVTNSGGGQAALRDPTALPQDDEDEEEQQEEDDQKVLERKEEDAVILRCLVKEVVPNALKLYLSGPLQTSSVADITRKKRESQEEEEEDYELVTGQAEGEESLPLGVRRTLHALKSNQKKLDELMRAKQEREVAAAKKLHAQVHELYASRRKHVLSEDAASPAVPKFWMRSLRALDTAVLAVHKKDEEVLQYLSDVRWKIDLEGLEGGERTGLLELEFLPNSHMENPVLKKVYHFIPTQDVMDDQLAILTTQPDAVVWKPGKDLTMRKGPKGKLRPTGSFFWLFKPGGARYAFGLIGDDKETIAAANALEVDMLMEIQRQLLPHALELYQSACEVDTDVEEEESDEDQDVEEEGEEGQEEDAGDEGARRALPAKKSGAPFKLTKAHIFLGLIALMILADIFLFLGYSSSRKNYMR